MSRVLAGQVAGLYVYLGDKFDFGLGEMRLQEVVRQARAEDVYIFRGTYGYAHVGSDAFATFLKRREQAAKERAEELYSEGYHCVSGKHLKVATWKDPLCAKYGVQNLRERLVKYPESVKVQTVDVDTYVALKKLRREWTFVPAPPAKLYDYQQDFLRRYADLAAVPRPPSRTEFFSGGPCGKTQTGRIYGRGLADAMLSKGEFSTRPPTSRAEAKARFVSTLEALPDSLYKRTQLRYMRLPQAASKDHEARKKAFDREVKKFNQEKQQ